MSNPVPEGLCSLIKSIGGENNEAATKSRKSPWTVPGVMCVLLLGVLLCSGACGTGEDSGGNVTETPSGTEMPTEAPKNWFSQMLSDGRTELSKPVEALYGINPWLPVSASKTVRLGEFEYTVTVPQTLFRLQELQDGTSALEITSVLRYVGEKESITIAHGDMIFMGGVVEPSGRVDGGGRYDVEEHTTLQKGEEISFTKVYDKFSREVGSAGAGIIEASVEFAVLDENEERTGESWDYLLAIPYDVVEE